MPDSTSTEPDQDPLIAIQNLDGLASSTQLTRDQHTTLQRSLECLMGGLNAGTQAARDLEQTKVALDAALTALDAALVARKAMAAELSRGVELAEAVVPAVTGGEDTGIVLADTDTADAEEITPAMRVEVGNASVTFGAGEELNAYHRQVIDRIFQLEERRITALDAFRVKDRAVEERRDDRMRVIRERQSRTRETEARTQEMVLRQLVTTLAPYVTAWMAKNKPTGAQNAPQHPEPDLGPASDPEVESTTEPEAEPESTPEPANGPGVEPEGITEPAAEPDDGVRGPFRPGDPDPGSALGSKSPLE